MRQQRKDQLLCQFPPVPPDIMDHMANGDIFGKSRACNYCVFLTYGKELFVRCYHKYSRSKAVKEAQRYVFTKDGFCRYGLNNEGKWKAMPFREPVFYNAPYYADNSYMILNPDAITRSDMRYSRLFEWSQNSSGFAISYLQLYCKYPNIEYLVESGYGDLIGATQSFYGRFDKLEIFAGIDLKSNDLRKMLGLTRTEVKLLQGYEKRYIKYRIIREKLPGWNSEDIIKITVSPYSVDDLISFSRLTGNSVMRMYRYLSENDLSSVIYRDYADQCRRLGYDMHDTAVGLPHDLHALHTRYSQIIKYKKSEEEKQEFASRLSERTIFEYSNDDLILCQPQCIDEIISEGSALCHCVGGYAERHARGKTNIFFIRRKSEPLKPYFTIEVSNSYEIIQCHGYKNDKVNEKPDEIKAFEEEYQQYLEELKHEQQRNKRKSA